MLKKIWICAIIMTALFFCCALAEGGRTEAFSMDMWPEDMGDGQAFSRYVDGLFGISNEQILPKHAHSAGEVFEGKLKTTFEACKAFIHEIAIGNSSYTQFNFDGYLSREDTELLRMALKIACGHELYWCDRTYYITYQSGDIFGGNVRFEVPYIQFIVDEPLQDGDDLHVNTQLVKSAQSAAENARAIVKKNAALSDLEKLRAYKDTICDLVDYDYEATYMSNLPEYTQHMIHVFDDAPETKVVCAGYVEAFQYLCDQSDFKEDTRCIHVTGDVEGDPHAWNIVHMSNDKNYVVDVTYSDTSRDPHADYFFLIGYDYGSISEGYVISGVRRKYSDEMTGLYAAADLTLSNHSYAEDLGEDGAQVRDGFAYEVLSDGTASILRCSRTGDVEIPETLDGYRVTNLAPMLFATNDAITSVTLPASVTSFGDGTDKSIWERVFAYTSHLKEIRVAAGNPVFQSVDGVLYSRDMTILYHYPTARTDTAFTVPRTVLTIANTAFAGTNHLTSLTLTNRNTRWQHDAFENDGQLTVHYLQGGESESLVNDLTWRFQTHHFNDNCPTYDGGENSPFIYEVLDDGTAMIIKCSLTGDVTIPSEIDGYKVTRLASKLFYGSSSYTRITLPATVTGFGDDPSDNLWDYVFSYCQSLEAITVHPDNPVFCSVDGVLYSKDMTLLYNYPCARANATYFVPESVRKIACTAFASARNLTTVNLLAKNATWMTYTFYDDPDMTVNYLSGGNTEFTVSYHTGEGLTHEGDASYPSFRLVSHFDLGPVPDLVLPTSLKAIGEEAFAGGGFTCVKLPEGVASIGPRAFADCSKLTDVYIPSGTTDIADNAFAGVKSLTIHGVRGSAAEQYAVGHSFAFSAE